MAVNGRGGGGVEEMAAVLLRHLQEAFGLANQMSRFPGFKLSVFCFFLPAVVVVGATYGNETMWWDLVQEGPPAVQKCKK